MTQDEYSKLVSEAKDQHSCLLFEDDSISPDLIAMFVPSRAFSLQQLKVYLTGFGLTDADVVVVPLHKRPRNAPPWGDT